MYPAKAASYKLLFTFDCGVKSLFWAAKMHDKSSPKHQCDVAIKVIQLDDFSSENSIHEIKNEISIIDKCHHPNVLEYYTSFTHEKELWIVMPMISGGQLGKLVKSKFKMGIKDESLIASILL
jgi:serine/threonine-protein kinase OSR1/STK39